jgi:hypothetical protein
MRCLIGRYPMGVLIDEVEPGAIAAAINRMDRSMIDICKANALKAARDLCWEREAETLVGLVEAALAAESRPG